MGPTWPGGRTAGTVERDHIALPRGFPRKLAGGCSTSFGVPSPGTYEGTSSLCIGRWDQEA